MSFNLELNFFVYAAADEVLELLTDAEFIKEWSGGNASFEKREGGQFEMFDGWVTGKVLKITDDELVYTWKPTGWNEETEPSEVYYKLVPVEHGTEVLLKHVKLPSEKEMESHKDGWDKHFFGLIGEFLANRNF